MSLPVAKTVFEGIKEPNAFGGAPEMWDEAMQAMGAGDVPFLDIDKLPAKVKTAGLAADRVELLKGMVRTIGEDENLKAFAWFMYWRIFVVPEKGIPWGAPSLETRLGNMAGQFYMLLSLEWASVLRAYHEKLGYPSQVTEDTLVQIVSYEENHLRGNGGPGMYPGQFSWLATYLSMPYIKLGRFEYQLHPYGGGAVAYRRQADWALMLLAEDGTRVGDNGLKLPSEAPADVGWTAKLAEADGKVVGNLIDPAGYILKQEVSLDLSEWQAYLKAGDTVLDLHIPAGGKMDWDSMVESFKRATEFFKEHHADQSWKALVVTTWFMDPRLAEILPADSNPILLQRCSYLYPNYPDPDSLWFVFLAPVKGADPAKLPRDTSLQRKLADFLVKGNVWHGGSFLILPEEVAEPKLDYYRQRHERLKKEIRFSPLDKSIFC